MNKNLKDRADRLWQSVYLDGYEHGYKDALISTSNYIGSDSKENMKLKTRNMAEEYIKNGMPLDSSIEIIDNTGDTE